MYASLIKKDSIQGKTLSYLLQDITAEQGKTVISLKKEYRDYNQTNMDADWIKDFAEKNGRMPDLFGGA